jgi:hypothetical protein
LQHLDFLLLFVMPTTKAKPNTQTSIDATERRLQALEAEVARLKSSAKAPKTNIVWVERIAGSFIDDGDYKEAMRLGRAYRRRQQKC